ncbi:MAG: MFS transporter [Nitrospirae bacterium RIFCSPLOWO2_01_FULL_62_17]|nr:MAG: MFS transporter [Nitrospirae bacterium RIFCSPLOWO2_01_FULL_62_17]
MTSMTGRPSSSWREGVTPYQWLVLFVAWLGWVFDSMDATIYAIVLHPALDELLRTSSGGATPETIGWHGGLIFSIFLIGWAIGGVLFGIVADRYGRTKTLIATILIYAVFTGLAALSQTWWHLAVYRFLTALGIGGEWAAGAALVAEVRPEDKRAKAAGLLQSAWAAGFFLAALFNLLLRGYGWRALFVVGIMPAVAALLVRLWVKEPERWVQAHRQESEAGTGSFAKLAELFRGDLLRPTLAGSTLAFVAVFGLWGSTNWTPTLITTLPDLQGLSREELSARVSYAIMALNVGALFGYLSFGPLADRFGRRPVFALMCAGSLVMLPITFLTPREYLHVLLLLPVLGFFNNGIFSGFPIYLPELYPTRLRATGAGFCFNAGRVFASVGPFLTGWLTATMGSVGHAVSVVGLIYVVGLLVLPFAPETKGNALPD